MRFFSSCRQFAKESLLISRRVSKSPTQGTKARVALPVRWQIGLFYLPYILRVFMHSLSLFSFFSWHCDLEVTRKHRGKKSVCSHDTRHCSLWHIEASAAIRLSYFIVQCTWIFPYTLRLVTSVCFPQYSLFFVYSSRSGSLNIARMLKDSNHWQVRVYTSMYDSKVVFFFLKF